MPMWERRSRASRSMPENRLRHRWSGWVSCGVPLGNIMRQGGLPPPGLGGPGSGLCFAPSRSRLGQEIGPAVFAGGIFVAERFLDGQFGDGIDDPLEVF